MSTTTTARSIRVRTQRQPVVGGDHLAARPPGDLLPESLRALAAERDALTARLAEGRRDLRDLTGGPLAEREREAGKADRRAVSEAARAGKTLRNPSAHLDAVRARQRAAADLVAAAGAGLEDVRLEAATARAAEAENPAHRARVAAARERVHTAAADLEAALIDAAQALAVVEWLEDGMPFEKSARIDLESLAAGAVTGGGGHRGVDALAAVRTIARWAD